MVKCEIREKGRGEGHDGKPREMPQSRRLPFETVWLDKGFWSGKSSVIGT